jgi:DNA-binding transcriptional LysR family regulator
MDRLYLMTVYVAVAEEQGFAAGARRLGMSPPAVTRAVAALSSAWASSCWTAPHGTCA